MKYLVPRGQEMVVQRILKNRGYRWSTTEYIVNERMDYIRVKEDGTMLYCPLGLADEKDFKECIELLNFNDYYEGAI